MNVFITFLLILICVFVAVFCVSFVIALIKLKKGKSNQVKVVKPQDHKQKDVRK